MKTKIVATICTAFLSLQASAQQKMTTEQYISVFKDLAIAGMREYRVPASITMAQGILESASGNSRLATEANNHFGIKCKPEWTGDKILHDDDAKDECFRKYDSAYDSYVDHGKFLAERKYYVALFDLDIMDYVAWARGLKTAGYATSPTYADNLIRIIETNKLYKLDEEAMSFSKPVVKEEVVAEVKPTVKEERDPSIYYGVKVVAADYMQTTSKSIPTYMNNGVKFVIARKGDNIQVLASLTGKSPKALLKYNELDTVPSEISEGSIIYVSSKKSKASNGYTFHTVSKGETLHYVSQKYGIKISKLAKMNLYSTSYTIKPGQKMLLR
ncbi:MAG: glucosaminidase domain-containing protein [Rikenellaceae bacterium]